MTQAYRTDLAFIHDAGFGQFAEAAAPVLLRTLRQRRFKNGLVVDLGCGSGILSELVAAAGFDLLGIDMSPAMVRMARQRVPSATVRVGSIWAASLPSCVAVAAVGECINYLFDARSSEASLRRFLKRTYNALVSGGLLLFDAAGPGRVPEEGPVKSHISGDDWTVLVTATEDRRRQILTRKITSFRRVGRTWRRNDETHRLRLYSPSDVLAALRHAGFEARALRGYGKAKLPPGWTAYLAIRP